MGNPERLARRKKRIEAEQADVHRRKREREAFQQSQPKGPETPIRVADIPVTRFEG